MKAVILCAGRSTRTYPLTVNKPKVLLKIMNKTIIEHNLEQLNGLVNEVVLVIGFKGDMIKKFIGDSYKKDIVGGKNMGMTTIWINKFSGGDVDKNQADFVVKHLKEISPILKELIK